MSSVDLDQVDLSKLPTSASGLLELALADLKKQEECASPDEVDMRSWLAQTGSGGCAACFAGSVMRFSLGLTPADVPTIIPDPDADFEDRSRFWQLAAALDKARAGYLTYLFAYCGHTSSGTILLPIYDAIADKRRERAGKAKYFCVYPQPRDDKFAQMAAEWRADMEWVIQLLKSRGL